VDPKVVFPFFFFFKTWSCCVAQAGLAPPFSCLSLPSAGITGVYHHAQLTSSSYLQHNQASDFIFFSASSLQISKALEALGSQSCSPDPSQLSTTFLFQNPVEKQVSRIPLL
jgi:hypothetical protein